MRSRSSDQKTPKGKARSVSPGPLSIWIDPIMAQVLSGVSTRMNMTPRSLIKLAILEFLNKISPCQELEIVTAIYEHKERQRQIARLKRQIAWQDVRARKKNKRKKKKKSEIDIDIADL